MLARLVERAGNFSQGSITAFYTVLMEGDDQQDPVVDTVRSLLDGHMLLDRNLAHAQPLSADFDPRKPQPFDDQHGFRKAFGQGQCDAPDDGGLYAGPKI